MNRHDPSNARTLSDSELKTPGKVLIKRKHLLQKVPLCERTILDMEKRGEFPRRFAITSRMVAWDLDEVEAWINLRRTAAAQAPSPGGKRS
ncbi:helix-turn-helix transcriptional regulator [Pseudoduganella aquatica]|uniref:AlpA family phage regulatory protein n=1 Tax=Pseudoduganella aquatica TaxID=2660641 RepID=A0A7X4KN70_9BURK|nr:AlpA family phage regulatory protein [Pseudoduganella aquatica]MYN08878.1 AlpA family phage regulatory protein [Pseudoduganella aquatica]